LSLKIVAQASHSFIRIGLNANPDPAFSYKADPIRILLYATESRQIYADPDSGQAYIKMLPYLGGYKT
jgi:hypothetical protein